MEKQEIISGNLEEARKAIDRAKKENKVIIVQGRDIEFNRIILENRKVNILVLSHTSKKDMLKQRDSGLNQVLCKLAKDHNIALALNLNELKIGKDKKEKALIIARIIQNIELAKKFKNKVILLDKQGKDRYELQALFKSLGANSKLASEIAS